MAAATPPDRADPLYELPPEEFVAARDELAKQLRAEGDKQLAKEVKALRRPTVTAWALNQFVRRHRAEAEALIEAGRVAAQAQAGALSGSSGDLRAALRARSEAVQRAVALTAAVLAERGSPADEAELQEALSSGSSDEEVGRALLEARLSQVPSAAGSGLGSLDALLAASLGPSSTEADVDPVEAAGDEITGDEGAEEQAEPADATDAEVTEADDDAVEVGGDEDADAAREASRRDAAEQAAREEELERRRSELRRLQIRALEAEDAAADADAAVRRAQAALEEARAAAQERRQEAELRRREADDAASALESASEQEG